MFAVLIGNSFAPLIERTIREIRTQKTTGGAK